MPGSILLRQRLQETHRIDLKVQEAVALQILERCGYCVKNSSTLEPNSPVQGFLLLCGWGKRLR